MPKKKQMKQKLPELFPTWQLSKKKPRSEEWVGFDGKTRTSKSPDKLSEEKKQQILRRKFRIARQRNEPTILNLLPKIKQNRIQVISELLNKRRYHTFRRILRKWGFQIQIESKQETQMIHPETGVKIAFNKFKKYAPTKTIEQVGKNLEKHFNKLEHQKKLKN